MADNEVEEVEKELEEACIIKPLDGGYGWLVVFASFLANLIVDGVIFTAGDILLSVWTKDFDTTEAAAALTMSILSGSYLLIGPVASVLANLYGCRTVVIAGSVLAFFGFICSTIAPQIYFLYFSFGLVGGIGFGLIYLPAIVIISQYFAEKRSIATGLAVCGSGIGTTLFSTINPYVMSALGSSWRLFLVYLALCSLLCIISALIFRPVTASENQIEKVTKITEAVAERKDSIDGKLNGLESPLEYRPRFDSHRPFLSTIELNAHKNTSSKVLSQHDLAQSVAKESVRNLNRPLSKMDAFYVGSTTNLRQRSKTISGSRVPVTQHEDVKPNRSQTKESNIYLSSIGLPTQDDPDSDSSASGWKRNMLMTLKSLLDTSLLYSPSFMILASSGFLTLCCFYVPYNYIGKHIDKIEGLSPTMKTYPVALLGIINIVARVVCGWIADRPQVDALLVSNISLIMAGVATCMVPFFTEFWMFIAYCFPFGCGVACFAALRSVICVDLFGLDKLSNAFGILLTFMGVGAVIGTPLAAFIKDITGDFDVSFYIMGSLMAISGLVCLPLRQLRNYEERKIRESDAENDVELERLN